VVTVNGTSAVYKYDGNGLRVYKDETLPCGSDVTRRYTTFVFSGSKVLREVVLTIPCVGQGNVTTREYVYAGSQLVAIHEDGPFGSTLKYTMADHLSTRVTSDLAGANRTEQGHYPFGESWYNASGAKLLFTSYERDAESGNDYAMMRFQVNRLGRFNQPDLVEGAIGDPQTLNRFAYVTNDPTNLTDPLGLEGRKGDWLGSGDRFAPGVGPLQASGWRSIGLYSLTIPTRTYGAYFGRISPPTGSFTTTSTLPGGLTIEMTVNLSAEYGLIFGWYETGGLFLLPSIPPGETPPGPDGPTPEEQTPCGGGIGLGIGGGGNVDAGLGFFGASATVSGGGGVFYNHAGSLTSGLSLGGFTSGGATAYAGSHVVGAPKQDASTLFTVGAYAGGGANLFITNAASAQQLRLTTTTFSMNVGVGIANLGVQVSTGNGIHALSITPPIVSAGIGFGFSAMTTKTKATSTGCR
jgi:RHS repeat-associated protein